MTKRGLLLLLVLVTSIPGLTGFAASKVPLDIRNKTGSPVSISFTGAATYYFRLDNGKTTVQVMPGKYSYLYKACGTTYSGQLKVVSSGGRLDLTKCTKTAATKCDPSYPTVCIPPPPPDLDCSDIPYRNFKVKGKDRHHFDGDHDGIGCETYY